MDFGDIWHFNFLLTLFTLHFLEARLLGRELVSYRAGNYLSSPPLPGRLTDGHVYISSIQGQHLLHL